jgi:predicted nucleic acid-binding protein
MYYIDTSVLAAYYCPEPFSDVAEDYLLSERRPAVSQLTEVELASAVSRKVRVKELPEKDGLRILDAFQSHIDALMYTYLILDSRHYQLARSWISRFSTPLRTLDALHLAVSATSDLELITADNRLAESASRLGIKAKLIVQKSP